MNAHRPGFTFAELMVVVVLGAMVLAAVYQTLIIQEKSAQQQNAIISAQQGIRTALDVLAGDLREISAASGDVVAMTAESLTVRASRKVGFVCATHKNEQKITVWELADAFSSGDSILIFADGDVNSANDDTWVQKNVSNASAVNCPSSWDPLALVGSVIATGTGRQLSVGDIVPVEVGAPVRSFARTTYQIARSDQDWALARRIGTGSLDPLIGPLAPPEERGLTFRYFDNAGNITATLTAVSRIEVKVRSWARTREGQRYADSLETQIHLRNN